MRLQAVDIQTHGPNAPGNIHLTGTPAVLVIVATVSLILLFVVRFFMWRRQAGAARRLRDVAEAQLRTLFGAMDDVVFVLDRDGRYVDIPETRAHAEHRLAAGLLGRSLADVHPRDVAANLRAVTVRAVETRKTLTTEFQSPSSAGTW